MGNAPAGQHPAHIARTQESSIPGMEGALEAVAWNRPYITASQDNASRVLQESWFAAQERGSACHRKRGQLASITEQCWYGMVWKVGR